MICTSLQGLLRGGSHTGGVIMTSAASFMLSEHA